MALDTLDYFIIILLLLVIRSLLGGSHCKTYLSCLLTSVALFISIIILSKIIYPISIFYQSIIFLLLSILVLTKQDKQLETRPKRSKSYRLIQKIIALIFLLIILIISNSFFDHNLINCTVLTSILILANYILGGMNYEN